MEKIKVLVVDDQRELAEELCSLLTTDAQIEVVGCAYDGLEALQKAVAVMPDVVLLDIRMPNMNGVVTTKRIREELPNTKVLILTTFDDSDYILSAINNGASGYLLKDIGGNALLEAVKKPMQGTPFCLRKSPSGSPMRRRTLPWIENCGSCVRSPFRIGRWRWRS